MTDKVLASFAYPLGFALAVLICAAIAISLGFRRVGGAVVLVITGCLWTVSTPIVAHWSVLTLEEQYPPQPIENYKPADVIIVLGGALSAPGQGEFYPDLGEAADRIVHAFRLFKAGLAPKILVSGGDLFSDGRVSEAQAIAELLESWGVSSDSIVVDTASRNTFENAQKVREIWQREKLRSGLLVTSTMHMPRALAVFRNAGLIVEPVSTDSRGGHVLEPFPLSVLPNADSLDQVTQVTKEWIGLFVYRWRGWA